MGIVRFTCKALCERASRDLSRFRHRDGTPGGRYTNPTEPGAAAVGLFGHAAGDDRTDLAGHRGQMARSNRWPGCAR